MDEKITIYLKVKGKKHGFRLPPEAKLRSVVEKFRDQLNINAKEWENIHLYLLVSLDQSLGDISIKDETEIIALFGDEVTSSDIEYIPPK